jgi:large subunit ribosomal protein L18
MGKSDQRKIEVRKRRVRHKIAKTGVIRHRLSVHRTARHTYAQIIDDEHGETLVSASTIEKGVRSTLPSGANKDAAKYVGMLVAKKALENNIRLVVFDRGAHVYHGRIKVLAEAARENGLEF